MRKNFIVATAGHVDHGKSSLVKALTGIDPDRLPEEKARGITIDLGFAHLELRTGETVFDLGLVDVPGHEDFVKNMVAGVGSIDLALLVVAADDGWMPQTEEHFQILQYLRVKRVVVALTKIDLAQDVGKAMEEARAKIPGARIVPTSVVSGVGLEELKGALVEELETIEAPRDIGKARLPVDRVFTLQGVGVVVTGTLTGGTLRAGQSVILQPSGKRAKIRKIHTHNRSVEMNGPGTRTALNLTEVGADEVGRGDVVTVLEGGSSDTWSVVLERSARASGRGVKEGATVRVHFGSGNAEARVVFLEAKVLGSGERAIAQLRFDEPVFGLVGDSFIVRDAAEQFTLGGGVVLEQDAERRHFHTAEVKAFLEMRAAGIDDAAAFVGSELKRRGFAKKSGLLIFSRFSEAEIAAALGKLDVFAAGDLVADGGWWNALKKRASELIDAAHREKSDRAGLGLSELRAAVGVEEAVFEALVADLCANGFAQSGTAIGRATHRLKLPAHIEESAKRVRAALSGKPFDPPSVNEFAPDGNARQALQFLLQTGEAIELSKEIAMSAEAFARAVDEVKKMLGARGGATTSELRQLLGSSRRVIIPLLEFMDRRGVTRREGDRRVLKVV